MKLFVQSWLQCLTLWLRPHPARADRAPALFQTHCSVSRHLSARFRAWHGRWLEGHVSPRQEQLSEDWLLGRVDGLKPSRTTVQRSNDTARPPYELYNRYRVQWLEPAASAAAAAAATASGGGEK